MKFRFPDDTLISTRFIRLLVGAVFFSEGLQKFLYPNLRGSGRFADIGLPAPEFLGYFVGSVEAVCGAFLLIGIYRRWASAPLLAIMIVALATTKIPMIFNEGFWSAAHAARTDIAMTVGCCLLLFSKDTHRSPCSRGEP